MNDFAQVTFSQLWETEKQTLASLATGVQENGVIVEIGTAQGGSSFILSHASAGKCVSIYSYDIAPSSEAYNNLAGTGVHLYAIPSVEGAKQWNETGGRKIDMLLIDGSHTFQHIFEDMNAWIPFMQPGGIVVVHDFDSVERGGFVHFGTEVAIRALLSTKKIANPIHKDRFLYGRIDNPTDLTLDLQVSLEAFKGIGRGIKRLFDKDFSTWKLIGDIRFARLLSTAINIDVTQLDSHLDPLAEDKKYLIFERPLGPVFDKIPKEHFEDGSVLLINSLQACYLLGKGLSTRRDEVLDLVKDRTRFFGLEETLFMFEHAFGESLFPNKVEAVSVDSPKHLSQLVAREQIRLGILAELLEVTLDWKP